MLWSSERFMPGPAPVQFSASGAGTRTFAPALGEHTVSVMKQLGYSKQEIAEARQAGVIRFTFDTEPEITYIAAPARGCLLTMNTDRPADVKTTRTFALPVLFLGATGIAFAPIFVRLSEVGPVSTAFYRLFFALPMLWIWTRIDIRYADRKRREKPRVPRSHKEWKLICLAGLFFAGDLAVWHWSIVFTSVANATLFANFAPIFVTFGAWLLFQERITWSLLIAPGPAAATIGRRR